MGKSTRELLKRQAAEGVLVLGIKRVLLQVLFTVANIFLARLLFPADFGTIAIVGSVISFFAVFGDLGFGTALIQKKGKTTAADIKTAFTVQLGLGFLLMVLLNLSSGLIANFFNLGQLGVDLLKVSSLVFLIDPFRQIPGALVERNLGYKKLVIFDLMIILSGSITSVGLAFAGFGVWSLVFANIATHLVSVILLGVFARWPIGIRFAKKSFLGLASFGLPYQTNVFFGLFYGPLIFLYLGKQVGQENLGYFQFAASLSAFSLAFSDIVNRIVFPFGARVQGDEVFLKKVIERSMSIVSLTSLPLVFLMLSAVPHIIHFVYTDKWLPALPAMYLGIIQMGIIAYTGICGQILLALGKSKVMRNMGFVWAVMTWILAPQLIAKFNFVGMSLTMLLVSVSGIFLFIMLRRAVKFTFFGNFYPYFLASALAAGTFLGVREVFGSSLFAVVIALFAAFAVYISLVILVRREFVFSSLKLVLSVFRKV